MSTFAPQPHLLPDLEARQEEVLQQLEQLDEQIRKTLAELLRGSSAPEPSCDG